jgi:hypothetical protein
MDLSLYVVPALVGLVMSALTFGACHLVHRQRMRELSQRLDKIERARQTALQQSQQARRQIEQLQKDLAAQIKARSDAAAARHRAPPEPAPRESPRDLVEALLDAEGPPSRPAHGFADTMPLIDGPGDAR